MHGTLRHAGILVKDLEAEIKNWQAIGFEPLEIETLRVCKMTDKNGATIELVEGNWHPHIAVNWYEDDNGNYIETVKDNSIPSDEVQFRDASGKILGKIINLGEEEVKPPQQREAKSMASPHIGKELE